MLTTILTIIIVAILFGMTIFIHELGHFLTARWCGFTVETFSIGFGPALWQRKINGVVYKIGAIPFGGYVAIPQLDPTGMALVQGSSEPDKNDTPDTAKPLEAPKPNLPPMPPWKRMIVSAAGAIGNMILAFILAWVVYLYGRPASTAEESSVVGFVHPASLSYTNGLRCGDEIKAVNGLPVASWQEFRLKAFSHNMAKVTVKRDTTTVVIPIPGEESISPDMLDCKGLCMVFNTAPGMSAARIGLMRGDIISAFNGLKIFSPGQLTMMIQDFKGQSVPLTYIRNGKLLTANVTPDYDTAYKKVRIGIEFNPKQIDVDFSKVVHPLPSAQLINDSTTIFHTLKALTTHGQAGNTAKQIGGPLSILMAFYYLVKLSFIIAITFTVFLNVNLAILNLMPIPVLDGGHIVFALFEMIFRRPLPAKLINIITNAFAILLICLFVLLTYRDAIRMTPLGGLVDKLTGPKKEQVQKVQTAPVSTNAPAKPTSREPAPAP